MLEEWLVALQTAIAFANKEDALSICSELDEGGSKLSDANAVATSSSSSVVAGKSRAPDTESIGSEDISNSRTSEMQPWRGRNSAARALQPPIVDRRNMFSLYYRLQPLPHSTFESSTILPGNAAKRPTSSEISLMSPVKMRKTSSLKRDNKITFLSPQNHSNTPILVSIDFQGLTLRLPNLLGTLQQIEPFFIRLFVFDAMDGRRICEEFQILFNGDDLHVTEPESYRVLQLVNLSQDVALIVLNVAQTFAHQLAASQRHRHWPHSESLFHSLLSLHLRLADEHWSESVRLHVIAGLALFVNLFRARLFEGGPLEPLYMLIEKVLILMASRLPAVQAAAAALLQLILRNGYEVAQGYFASQVLAQSVSPSTSKINQGGRKGVSSERLGRPRSQTGVALARLSGFQSVLSNSTTFERDLSAVEALVDTRKGTKIRPSSS